jgi:hypothetical protein
MIHDSTYVVVNAKGEIKKPSFLHHHHPPSTPQTDFGFIAFPHQDFSSSDDPQLIPDPENHFSDRESFSSSSRFEHLSHLVTVADLGDPSPFTLDMISSSDNHDHSSHYTTTPSSSAEENMDEDEESHSTDEEEVIDEGASIVQKNSSSPAGKTKKVGRPKLVVDDKAKQLQKAKRKKANALAVKRNRDNKNILMAQMQTRIQELENQLHKAVKEMEQLKGENSALKADLKKKK